MGLTGSQHPKCDHERVDVRRSSSPSHTYIHGGLDSFLGVAAHLHGLSLLLFTHDWCSQVVWLGVTGLWYSFGLELSFGGGVFSRWLVSCISVFPSCPVASLSNMVGNVGVQ
jgi:hypothetical protein